MLSSNHHFKSGLVTLALCLGLSLSACQVRPLYSTTATSGQSLATELSTISIARANTRVEQEVRNHLIFAFNGGADPVTPDYELKIKLKDSLSNLAIESGTGLSQTTRVKLEVDYQLIRLSDKAITTKGTSFFTAEYARSSQRFANERAQIDAENRAAEQVANDIHLRLSAFFAAGT